MPLSVVDPRISSPLAQVDPDCESGSTREARAEPTTTRPQHARLVNSVRVTDRFRDPQIAGLALRKPYRSLPLRQSLSRRTALQNSRSVQERG